MDQYTEDDGSGGEGNTVTPPEEIGIYRGLASESEVIPDMYFYEIISTNEKTAKITGINLEYIFTEAFGEDFDSWPSFTLSASSGSNNRYTMALNQYVRKLVIPCNVSLDASGKYSNDGLEYTITTLERLFSPSEVYRDPNSDSLIPMWGTRMGR